MKLKKVLALVLALGMTVSAFAACGSSGSSSSTASESSASESSTSESEASTDESSAEGSESSTAPAAGGNTATFTPVSVDDSKNINLNAGMEPTGLNTLTSTYSIEFSLFKHLYENLVMLDENDNVVPGVAESWDVSDDSLTYTFHLRDDCTWTNGDPVTANDFEFAWSQVLNPEVAADYAYFLYIIKNAEAYFNGECTWEDVGVKVIDDYTFEVTLERATPYALGVFTFGTMAPVNQSFYEAVGADLYSTEAQYFCTNGAFALTEWSHNSQIVIQKNPAWHDADQVQVEQITWKIITDSNAALSSFLAGDLDVTGLSTGELISQAQSNGIEDIRSYADGAAFYIYFNHNNEYLSNANLRQALLLAIDKQSMIDTVYQNSNLPMTSFTSPGVTTPDGQAFAELCGELYPTSGNLELAQELFNTALEELGCTADDLSANLSVDCGDSTTAVAEASFYQEAWRQAFGIDVTVNSMMTRQGSENRRNGNYVMSLTGWGPDYNDPNTFLDLWVSDGGNNQTGYASEAYDKLIEDAAVETDSDARMQLFVQAEQMIAEDLPIAPMYWRNPSYTVSSKITGGLRRSMLQDINAVYVTLE